MDDSGAAAAMAKVAGILRRLRAPGGCPWDRAQTFDSIRQYTLEETYEVLEAIGERDWAALRDELGDLLLQVVFYAEMAREAGYFDLEGVLTGLADKLVRRHPHVFEDGSGQRMSAEEALGRWEAVKTAEKAAAGQPAREDSRLAGIPKHLPALAEAAKTGARAAAAGFDWSETAGVWDKMEEELAELRAAAAQSSLPELEDELGDVLFTAVNLARRLGLEPESALKRATRKFGRRFRWMEQAARREGRELEACTPAELDAYWDRAKQETA